MAGDGFQAKPIQSNPTLPSVVPAFVLNVVKLDRYPASTIITVRGRRRGCRVSYICRGSFRFFKTGNTDSARIVGEFHSQDHPLPAPSYPMLSEMMAMRNVAYTIGIRIRHLELPSQDSIWWSATAELPGTKTSEDRSHSVHRENFRLGSFGSARHLYVAPCSLASQGNDDTENRCKEGKAPRSRFAITTSCIQNAGSLDGCIHRSHPK
ncbi:hypothetical protein V8C40DRAFT_231472 [Trichoderma camerunense]